ncbi:hypothetical protein GCM10022251_17160 [Phytohabitans flavus]
MGRAAPPAGLTRTWKVFAATAETGAAVGHTAAALSFAGYGACWWRMRRRLGLSITSAW